MNYFIGLGQVLSGTFAGIRLLNGRIASRKSRHQLGCVVFAAGEDQDTRVARIEEAILRGLDVVVSLDGGHLELYAPVQAAPAKKA